VKNTPSVFKMAGRVLGTFFQEDIALTTRYI